LLFVFFPFFFCVFLFRSHSFLVFAVEGARVDGIKAQDREWWWEVLEFVSDGVPVRKFRSQKSGLTLSMAEIEGSASFFFFFFFARGC
jgi:hypothetical protein